MRTENSVRCRNIESYEIITCAINTAIEIKCFYDMIAHG